MLDLTIQKVICFQTYYVEIILGFQKSIDLRVSKSRIATEEPQDVIASITGNDWFQNALLVIGAMNVSIAKKGSLHIAKLIETEQRMITGAFKISVVGRTLLVAIGGTVGTVHIKNNLLGRLSLMDSIYPHLADLSIAPDSWIESVSLFQICPSNLLKQPPVLWLFPPEADAWQDQRTNVPHH